MTCPGFDQLLDYVDDRLDRTATEAIAGHLRAGCRECSRDLAWYQQLKQVAASDDSIEPPPWVLKRALRLFNAPRVRMNIAQVGRVVASLVFDSLRGPAVAGARSGGVEARQLMYRAADYSIDVQIAASDRQRAALTGQILREGELTFESVAGLPLDLMRSGGSTFSTVTNDRGEFTITAVEFGSYDLRVDLNNASITIVGLPISE
jgi:hypothetical protein